MATVIIANIQSANSSRPSQTYSAPIWHHHVLAAMSRYIKTDYAWREDKAMFCFGF